MLEIEDGSPTKKLHDLYVKSSILVEHVCFSSLGSSFSVLLLESTTAPGVYTYTVGILIMYCVSILYSIDIP